MKVTILMATSLNGMIALEDRSENFLSAAGGKLTWQIAVKTGALIWGRRTYETFQSSYDSKDHDLLADIPKIVVSQNSDYELVDGYELANSPQAALQILADKGLSETVIIGGSDLNRAFLEAGLVDEIIIDLEPIVVGKGLPLFAPIELEVRTQLLSYEAVNKGELLLRYKVVK